MRTRITLPLLLLTPMLFSTTLTVSLDGSQDYTTVQAAVDAATHGDTVLVYPGTYYENIVVNDKFITLGSLNLKTGDESYIHNTILDGNFSGSVIRMVLETLPQPADAVIQGFTIIHGSGEIRVWTWPEYGGGGIWVECDNNSGWMNVYITNCQIKYNFTDFAAGVGLAYYGNYHMKNVSVHHNIARFGPAGVFGNGGPIIHYPDYPCSYYANIGTPGHDFDIVNAPYNETIYADTLTCSEYDQGFIRITPRPGHDELELTVYHEHSIMDVIDHDLYVSPDGDDDNSGLSADDPLNTIRQAAYLIRSNPDNPRTIYLAPGEYTEEEGPLQFTVGLKDHVSLIGSGMDETFLECSQSRVIIYMNNNEDIQISGMTLKSSYPINNGEWSPCLILGVYIDDLTIKDIRAHDSEFGKSAAISVWHVDHLDMDNIIIEDNIGEAYCGLYVIAEDVTLTDCIIRNNRVVGYTDWYSASSAFNIDTKGNCLIDDLVVMNNVNECGSEGQMTGLLGHGSGYPGSSLKITNSLFSGNNSEGQECFQFQLFRGNLDLINCTFIGNEAEEMVLKFLRTNTEAEVDPFQVINTVFWDHVPYEISNWSYRRCAIEVNHSLIRNGIDGIDSPYDEIIWGEGNLDLNPLLTNAEQLYYPQEGSPIINAGTPDTTGLGLPPLDICNRARVWDGCVDIGCHEYGSVGVEPGDQAPVYEVSLGNYPNPFNPWTIISYSLPEAAYVELNVYNIRGQRVRTLVHEHREAGSHEVVWDGRNEQNDIVGSGVYLCRMIYSGKSHTHKMLLLQ